MPLKETHPKMVQEVIDVLDDTETWFLNHHKHVDCVVEPGIEWTTRWSCACDDECPACGVSISPYDYEEIE